MANARGTSGNGRMEEKKQRREREKEIRKKKDEREREKEIRNGR